MGCDTLYIGTVDEIDAGASISISLLFIDINGNV